MITVKKGSDVERYCVDSLWYKRMNKQAFSKPNDIWESVVYANLKLPFIDYSSLWLQTNKYIASKPSFTIY